MFKNRSYKKELLDLTEIEQHLLFQNLKELAFINRYLGGHAISIAGIKQIVLSPLKTYTVMDIGCGGGDSISALARWGNKNKYKLNFIGVDLKQDCIEYTSKHCKNIEGLVLKCEDFRSVFQSQIKIDIVHASLFCHHFLEEEIIEFIKLCIKNKTTFIVNDLERNPFAYYSIKWLTQLFSKSKLVKNDAPLSVLRGFKKKEWLSILEKANANNFKINNKWAFRHLLIVYPHE